MLANVQACKVPYSSTVVTYDHKNVYDIDPDLTSCMLI
jgi:hypothetical protein